MWLFWEAQSSLGQQGRGPRYACIPLLSTVELRAVQGGHGQLGYELEAAPNGSQT